MKFVIDMNLSPLWTDVVRQNGWEALHWSTIGAKDAPDHEIMRWARENGYIVFTHDLDFGAILATTQTNAPSVIQIRAQDVAPNALANILFTAIEQYQHLLESGALIIIDKHKFRARILPLG
jgi:predicted nuclease of predicted toxin-antitoxin system